MDKILLAEYQKRKYRVYTNEDSSSNSNITNNCNQSNDEYIEKQYDYHQLQINYLANKVNILENELKNSVMANNHIVNELNNIYDLIENNIVNKKQCECTFSKGCIMFSDTSKIHTFAIDFDIDMIFCTMIAGGGAGGLGHIKNHYYYSGGGGGAGACYIKKPIKVRKGNILKIKVGAGGSLNSGQHGEDSWIEIGEQIILVKGGENGNPTINYEGQVNGGKGGNNDYEICSGRDGNPGQISIPSNISAIGGNGANSIFFNGGQGGGNYFNNGGSGGNINYIIGIDGSYGSGGGGSCPSSKIDLNNKLSGNGGNGFVLLEWCCSNSLSEQN